MQLHVSSGGFIFLFEISERLLKQPLLVFVRFIFPHFNLCDGHPHNQWNQPTVRLAPPAPSCGFAPHWILGRQFSTWPPSHKLPHIAIIKICSWKHLSRQIGDECFSLKEINKVSSRVSISTTHGRKGLICPYVNSHRAEDALRSNISEAPLRI